MAAEHVALIPLIPQPRFPDHCFSCGASSPQRFIEVPVQPELGDFVVHNLTPWWLFMNPLRSDITIRVPACARCQFRMNRARSIQLLGTFSGFVLSVLAACISGLGGSTWVTCSVACVGAAGFATTFGSGIWEGATVPLLVSASIRGRNLRLKFDDARDQAEFERLNAAKDGMGAG